MPPLDDGSASFDMALGTWFYKLLVDELPGGLPADFFTDGCSSLLVCDRILCDRSSFESEMAFAPSSGPGWLSSRLFRELHDTGLLEPVDYRTLLSDAINEHRRAGLGEIVAERMAVRRDTLKDDPSSAAESLDATLAKVDQEYLNLLAREGLTPYGWRDGLLPAAASSDVELHAEPTQPFLRRAMAVEMPHTPVLLGPGYVRETSRSAYDGYRANLRRERLPLSLWMYGDPSWTRESYNEFRLGPDFRSADLAYDKQLEKQARTSLERILAVRRETETERRALQQHLRALPFMVVDGAEDGDLRRAALTHELAYRERLPADQTTALEMLITSAGLVSAAASLLVNSLELAMAGLSASAGGAGVLTANAHRRTAAREEEPLGYFYSRVRQLSRASA